MLATLVIVFREAIEAGLIIGIVLAASKGIAGRGWWVGVGVGVGGALACVEAAFAGPLAALFEGSGQEIFNAAVLLVAVVMLTWHIVWMAQHGREMAHDMRAVGTDVASGRRPLAALAVVVGVAVLREGSEVVLFLYGIVVSGGTSSAAMLLGGALGVGAGALVALLIYLGLVAVPVGKMLHVTGRLITLLAAGLAAQAVALLQQGGEIAVLTHSLWDTSGILPDDSVLGRVLHTLIGYTDQPTGAQGIAYGLTLASIMALSHRFGGHRHSQKLRTAASP